MEFRGNSKKPGNCNLRRWQEKGTGKRYSKEFQKAEQKKKPICRPQQKDDEKGLN